MDLGNYRHHLSVRNYAASDSQDPTNLYLSFRQNNEIIRKWNSFYQANKELIEEIGLPGPTVDTWDRFADLLMHGMIDHQDDPTHFDLGELNPEKLKLFRVLVVRYFEAGFPNPGIHSAMVGGHKALLKLVRKYPNAFSEQYQKLAEDVMSSFDEEWWLDRSALPGTLMWSRLTVYGDGSAEVLDLDGKSHEFTSRKDAEDWLSEDEYSPMDDLVEDGDLPATMVPPSAPSDAELVLKMLAKTPCGE
ncbi:MAG TPA: hypothetical protein VF826_16510 [Chloroflexia bacterium]|jgi:hypothetical protein